MKLPPYPNYKPSGVAWLGDIPEHWEVKSLKWASSGIINGIWGNEPNGEDDLICVRVADFDRERLRVIDEPPTVRAVSKEHRKGRMLKKGDVLIEKSGGGEKQLVGCVVYFDHDFDAVCSNFVARMPIASGHVPRFWLYVHAALYAGRLNYPAVKQTTGIQNLDAVTYLGIRLGFPHQNEQRAIANYLDCETTKIDALVAKKQTLIERLKEKRTALVSRVVTRGLPPDATTQAGLDPHPKLKSSGVAWLGDVPEHWEVRRLKYLARRIDKKMEANVGTSLPYIGMENIESWTGKLRMLDTDFLPVGMSNRFIEGDTLLGKLRPYLAKVCNVNFTGLCSSELLVLRVSHLMTRKFFLYMLLTHSFIALVNASTYGAKMPRTNWNFIGSLVLAVPPLDEQRAIADYLDRETAKIDTLLAKVEAAIDRLREYRAALITAAVTGKIDVRNGVSSNSFEQVYSIGT